MQAYVIQQVTRGMTLNSNPRHAILKNIEDEKRKEQITDNNIVPDVLQEVYNGTDETDRLSEIQYEQSNLVQITDDDDDYRELERVCYTVGTTVVIPIIIRKHSKI